LRATRRMFDLGGGVVVAEAGQIIFELPLALGGMMSHQDKQVHKSRRIGCSDCFRSLS